jgi:hypothetical protein
MKIKKEKMLHKALDNDIDVPQAEDESAFLLNIKIVVPGNISNPTIEKRAPVTAALTYMFRNQPTFGSVIHAVEHDPSLTKWSRYPDLLLALRFCLNTWGIPVLPLDPNVHLVAAEWTTNIVDANGYNFGTSFGSIRVSKSNIN